MRIRTIFAGTAVAALALVMPATAAFATTTGGHAPGPVPTSVVTPDSYHGQGGDNGNKCDPKGGRTLQVQTQDNRCKGDDDRNKGRGNDDNCFWDNNQGGRGVILNDYRGHDGDNRGRLCDIKYPVRQTWHQYCVNKLLQFNMAHGSQVLHETYGPWLSNGEVAFYNGQSYTIGNVHHTLVGHDTFTVKNSLHQQVTNWGRSIWHGDARVRICSWIRR